VWRYFSRSFKVTDELRDDASGWYVYAEPEEDTHYIQLLDDAGVDALDRWESAVIYLARPIRLNGRTITGFRRELTRALTFARSKQLEDLFR
jgi:hypothetical protein